MSMEEIGGFMDTDNILQSIKKLLGLSEEYYVFDPDIVIYINTAFLELVQMGIGPEEGFAISIDGENKWSEFEPNVFKQDAIKSFVYIKVRMLFDPPQNSQVVEALNKSLNEIQWRLESPINWETKEV